MEIGVNKTGPIARNIENPIWFVLSLRLIEVESKIAVLRRRLISAEAFVTRSRMKPGEPPPPGSVHYVSLERDYHPVKKNYMALLTRRDAALAAEKCRQ